VCVDASYDKYQAVAVRFDPLTASWTKFLHSEPNDTSTRGAIETLLRVSEEELVKLITANGDTLPFQGTLVQNLTLHRGQPRDASSEDSLLSDFVCVVTPGPNLLATVPSESGHRDNAIEVPASNDPSVDGVPVAEAAVEDILHESPMESVAVSGEIELACAELEPAVEVPEPALEESETFTSRWSSWGTGSKSKKNKKTKKTRFIFDETQPADEYLADIAAEELVPEEPAPEEPPAEAIVEEIRVEVEYSTVKACSSYDMTEEVAASHHKPDPSPPEDDISFRPFNGTKKETKKKSINLTQAPDIAPAPQPAEDFGWDSYSASTKKKFGKLIEQESLAPTEDEPVLERAGATEPPDDLKWGSCWASNNKNKKKKKGTKLLAPPEDEPLPEPSFPTEALDDLWGSISNLKKGKKKGKKKKGTKLIEESLAPPEDEQLPEPPFPTEALDDLWGLFSTSKKGNKKGKKGTKLIEESLAPPELEPALELAVTAEPPDDLWGSFSTSKKK
jgi:hypothetical protein